jgi:hypothetical protein
MTDLLELALDDLVPSFADEQPNWEDVVARTHGTSAKAAFPWVRRRGLARRSVLVLAAVAVLVAAVAAIPALGFVREALPFWSAAQAPPKVQVDFSSMNTGAPAGMSPKAIASDTREIGQFAFGGSSHTLWVAPSEDGGFCFEWIGGWGGCNISRDPFTWNGDLVIPAGAGAPTVPAGATPAEVAKAALEAHRLAVPRWISGYVDASRVYDVTITFTDGTVVHPQITWVSAPINAGFFAYDVPTHYQTEDNHLVNVSALEASGGIVKQQPLHP